MGKCPGGCRRLLVLGGIRNGDWVLVMATFLFFLSAILGAVLAVLVYYFVIEQIIEGGFDE